MAVVSSQGYLHTSPREDRAQRDNTDGLPRESEAIGLSTREVHTAHFYVTRLITLKLT